MNAEGIAALVTGAGSGLGAATARELAKRGARVTILDLGTSPGKDVAAEIGENALFCETDVTDEDQVAAALDQSEERFGGLRVAINCAGIGWAERTLSKTLEPHQPQGFRKVIEVNLIGTFNVLRQSAARIAKNEPDANGERGVIVNTASAAAYEGQIGQAAYSASKGGIVGMTLPVARDLAPLGIRVCSIAPGLFKTPLLMGLPESAREALERTIPFPSRLGEPPEFAALVLHIVENPMLNGEVIRIDGALRMPPK